MHTAATQRRLPRTRTAALKLLSPACQCQIPVDRSRLRLQPQAFNPTGSSSSLSTRLISLRLRVRVSMVPRRLREAGPKSESACGRSMGRSCSHGGSTPRLAPDLGATVSLALSGTLPEAPAAGPRRPGTRRDAGTGRGQPDSELNLRLRLPAPRPTRVVSESRRQSEH